MSERPAVSKEPDKDVDLVIPEAVYNLVKMEKALDSSNKEASNAFLILVLAVFDVVIVGAVMVMKRKK